MIVHLDKNKITQERRKLLADDVYVIFHDVLKDWYKDGTISLSPVEVFLSAKVFSKQLVTLPNVLDGLEDEMEDIEADAANEDDAFAIMMLSSAIIQAVGSHRIDIETPPIIKAIFDRWNNHSLFFPFLEAGCKKEQARWLDGKRTNLLSYELEQIDSLAEGEEVVNQFFDYFIDLSANIDKESVKGCLLVLNKYNLDHDNVYASKLLALYEKFGIELSPSVGSNNGIIAGGDIKVEVPLSNEHLQMLMEKQLPANKMKQLK